MSGSSSSDGVPLQWTPGRSAEDTREKFAFVGVFDPGDFEDHDIEVDHQEASLDPAQLAAAIESCVPDGKRRFMIGQHKGMTYGQLIIGEPGYISWGLSQPNPSPVLLHFLRWCIQYFEQVNGDWEMRASALATGSEIDAALERARVPQASTGRNRKSKLSLIPKKEEPCPGGCPVHALNRAGSNWHQIKETCMICGHKNQFVRPKVEAAKKFAECSHDNVDFRGSTRSTHKTFCKDCQTVIDEMPQHLWKAKRGLAKEVMSSGSRVGGVVARTLDHTALSVDAAKEVIKQFVRTQNKTLASKSETSSTELISCLQDCIDDYSVREMTPSDRAESSSAPRGSRGYTATVDEMKEVPEAGLPLIDPHKDDERVWVLIDEGCNSICHGEQWRKHAEKLMPGCIQKLSDKGSSYSGVGSAECTGVYLIHFRIKLEPSGLVIRGSFKSNELEGSSAPLLLSLAAQAKLGFVKDVRRGLCHLEDYPGQRLPLARSVSTGLVMFCINEPDSGARTQWHCDVDAGDAPEVSLVATSVPMQIKDKAIKIVTFGIETVGITDHSTRRSKRLHSLIRSLDQGSYEFTLADDTHMEALIQDLRLNHPSLITDYAKQEILFSWTVVAWVIRRGTGISESTLASIHTTWSTWARARSGCASFGRRTISSPTCSSATTRRSWWCLLSAELGDTDQLRPDTSSAFVSTTVDSRRACSTCHSLRFGSTPVVVAARRVACRRPRRRTPTTRP